jgi:tRNA(adenine34) deaminase
VAAPLIINPFDDEHFMREALRQARKAAKQDEVPIGAQAESALGDWRLTDCDLYVTKEPCPMCAGAIMHCRVRRVIFGCPDVKGGAAGGYWNLLQAPNLNHRTEITPGILNDDCVRILKEFFAEARRRRAEGLEHKKGAAKESEGGDSERLVFDGP